MAAALTAALLTGCGVIRYERPPAPQPAPPVTRTTRTTHRPMPITARRTPVHPDSVRVASRRLVYTRHARRTLVSQLARDTLAATAAVRRCRGTLLPGDESTRDAVVNLLGHTRTALGRGDYVSAVSYARDARQLSSALTPR